MKRTTHLRRLLGTGLGCVVLGATVVAMAAPAGAADGSATTTPAARHRVHLTVAQRQCLKTKGITRPLRPLTAEKVQQLKDAAKACDIQLPLRKRLLTADQKQCLSEHGIARPIRPLTPEKVQQLKDAAKACDIQLPLRKHALTAEQRQCMQQHGVTRPIRPLTAEKVQTIKNAATACGVQLHAKFGAKATA